MAYADINSEDRLVQETFAEHLRDKLGWESVYAWNQETFGPAGTLGRTDAREVVLTRELRAALVRLNPQLPPAAITEAVQEITRHDFTRSLLQHNQAFFKLIREGVPVSYKDANGVQRDARARVIDFKNGRGAGGKPNNRFLAVRELKITGLRTPGYNRRADHRLFRQRAAIGVHRVEGDLSQHPPGLRRQPAGLHAAGHDSARVPSQRISHCQQRASRPLRFDHERLGAFRRMETAG